MKRFIILAGLIIATAVSNNSLARLYQWESPDSGKMQMSGSPPAWYRSQEIGPRVFVFERGQLVDDTSIAVSDAQRQELRTVAFERAAVSSEELSVDIDQEAKLIKALEDAANAGVDIDAVAEQVAETRSSAEPETLDPAQDLIQKASQLRSLITAWDQNKVDQAKSLLGILGGDSEAQE
ncbi:MAG: hypothetical protein AAF384_03895 [Pseudomonadota bacterium]